MVCVTGQYLSRTIDWKNFGASYDMHIRLMALCSFKLYRIDIPCHAYIWLARMSKKFISLDLGIS